MEEVLAEIKSMFCWMGYHELCSRAMESDDIDCRCDCHPVEAQ